MEIYAPRLETQHFPRFQIHYRPKPKGEGNYNTAIGSIVLIEGTKHLLFFGEDQRTNYPLLIVTNYDPEGMDRFNGLVIRLHETGRFFASRVCFVKIKENSKFKTLSDLDSVIGLYSEDDEQIAGEIKDLLGMMINEIERGGKSGLLMHY
jgi:hypothetical protein